MSDADRERQLWDVLKREANGESGATIRIGICAENEMGGVPIQQVKQIVRRWQNSGLVIAFEGGKRAMLTETGTKVDDPTNR